MMKNNSEKRSMAIVMIPQDEWDDIMTSIKEIKEMHENMIGFQSKLSEEWLNAEEVQDILGISSRTFLRYREQRIISYSQIGRKIFVKRRDLDEFIQSYYIPTRA